MQAVDILRDDRGGLAMAGELAPGAVSAIGPCAAKRILHREAPSPCLPPRFVRGEKIREIARGHSRPDAARAAKIRNARLGADAGAGEYDRPALLFDHSGEFG